MADGVVAGMSQQHAGVSLLIARTVLFVVAITITRTCSVSMTIGFLFHDIPALQGLFLIGSTATVAALTKQ